MIYIVPHEKEGEQVGDGGEKRKRWGELVGQVEDRREKKLTAKPEKESKGDSEEREKIRH